ncbi:MAG: DUF4433 domain-containing protein [Chlamydiales bacterium]|nr:DUF4433 domain-containing protein [Chlamydiales bacterium]MBY0530195.1 DUF4433 domain-containing protein [Rhabdochlamydiaceae bacterium]
MKDCEFTQLFYITHLDNLESILEKGILSHARAQRLPHKKIDMWEVQERRKTKRVPQGKMLHEYANLYFSARNPMLYKRKGEHNDICVLRVKKEVLNISGVVITTGNAASEYVAFYPPETGIEKLNRAWIFAKDWTDPNPKVEAQKRVAKCAEVLIPDCVTPSLIFGAYVLTKECQMELAKKFTGLFIEQNPIIFFKND